MRNKPESKLSPWAGTLKGAFTKQGWGGPGDPGEREGLRKQARQGRGSVSLFPATLGPLPRLLHKRQSRWVMQSRPGRKASDAAASVSAVSVFSITPRARALPPPPFPRSCPPVMSRTHHGHPRTPCPSLAAPGPSTWLMGVCTTTPPMISVL